MRGQRFAARNALLRTMTERAVFGLGLPMGHSLRSEKMSSRRTRRRMAYLTHEYWRCMKTRKECCGSRLVGALADFEINGSTLSTNEGAFPEIVSLALWRMKTETFG